MKKSVGLRTKTYAHLMNKDPEKKKAKGTKKMCNKKNTQF